VGSGVTGAIDRNASRVRLRASTASGSSIRDRRRYNERESQIPSGSSGFDSLRHWLLAPASGGCTIGAPGFDAGTSPTRIMGEIGVAHGNSLQIALLSLLGISSQIV
jgi:hypothetical protein